MLLSARCSLVLALLLSAAPASAFYVTQAEGVLMRYSTAEPVEFRVPADIMGGDDTRAAIAAAFAAWDAVACSELTFTDGGADADPRRDPWATGSRYITVFFAPAGELVPSGNVARHYVSTDTEGKLNGAAIVLNSTDFMWSTGDEPTDQEFDIQSVVTAMIGKSLGIASDVEGNVTRPGYQTASIAGRDLGEDDIAAITYLYPASGCSTTEPVATCPVTERGCLPGDDPPAGDGGPGGDGGPTGGDGGPTGGDGGPTDGDGGPTGGDGGPTGGDEADDDGCGCRVAGDGDRANGLLALLVVGLLLLRRRR